MRALFDAYWWDEGPMSNRSVQREFILTWMKTFPQDEVVLALRHDAPGIGIPSAAEVVRTRLRPHGLANRFEFGRLSRQAGADISIVHNFTPGRGRAAVFIHDVMFVDSPEWFSVPERAYFSWMLPWARSAAVVATSTQTEANRITRVGRRISRPIPVGLGVPRALADATPRRPARLPSGIEGFAVTVGRLNVRKNLERVMAAAALSKRIDKQHPLLVVGNAAHSGIATDLTPDIRRSMQDGEVVILGAVADDELAWLYSNTALAITLSLDEGFGMPAIEAAHFDAPLIASDIPVFRETVHDYARFVPPGADPIDVASAIDEMWGQLADGTRVRTQWTWDRAVRALRDAVIS